MGRLIGNNCRMLALHILVSSICIALTWAQTTVNTQYGSLIGNSKTLPDGRPYDEFLGIPYVSPPRRFEPADAPVAWTGLRNATEYGVYCNQLLTPVYPLISYPGRASEDCLYLNVFVPEGVDSIKDSKLPVMVFFYGGAFLIGITDMYPGEDLAVNAEVIVVTVSYRVGALGWLSTMDQNAVGNYGLWDAAASLKWVHENIDRFGGDPERVTVFGQSAGSSITSHLAVSPYSRDYFQRMIGVSGSSTAYFSLTRAATSMARQTALLFGCPVFINSRMVECLKEKSPLLLDIFGIGTSLIIRQKLPDYIPVFDEDFVAVEPRTSWEAGIPKDKDILVGSTHDDGAGFVLLNFLGLPTGTFFSLAQNKALLNTIIRFMLNSYGNPDELYEMVVQRYPDIQNDDEYIRTRTASQMLTDFVFGGPAHLEANLHSKSGGSGNTYLYNFSYRQSCLKYVPWVNGSHIDDLYSIFGQSFMQVFRRFYLGQEDFSETDLYVSRSIQKYYGNFAYTGNPNEGPHKVDEVWPEYNADSKQYMLMAPTFVAETQDDDMLSRYKFWNEDFFYASRPGNMDAMIDRPEFKIFQNLLSSLLKDFSENDLQSYLEDPDKLVALLKTGFENLLDVVSQLE